MKIDDKNLPKKVFQELNYGDVFRLKHSESDEYFMKMYIIPCSSTVTATNAVSLYSGRGTFIAPNIPIELYPEAILSLCPKEKKEEINEN